MCFQKVVSHLKVVFKKFLVVWVVQVVFGCYAEQAFLVKFSAPAPAVSYAALAPVVEYNAPVPAVT